MKTIKDLTFKLKLEIRAELKRIEEWLPSADTASVVVGPDLGYVLADAYGTLIQAELVQADGNNIYRLSPERAAELAREYREKRNVSLIDVSWGTFLRARKNRLAAILQTL